MKAALAIFVILVAVLLSFIFNKEAENRDVKKPLRFWPYVKKMWNKNDNLRTHKRVAERLGFRAVNGSGDDNWDLLWSIEYPFYEFPDKMKNLKPHQRVNHFPGINYITNKALMSTTNRFPFVPASFRFPKMRDEFSKFITQNPNTKLVVKSEHNRGVEIVTIDKVDFEKTNEKVYQEFIENPLLIDDRAFDMGVYVLIASINPLRIYRFKSEVLLRFCPEPYYPFDPKNVDKYVIYETQKIVTEMPSLKDQVTKLGYSFKASFEDHLESRGYNVTDLWRKVDDVIVTLVSANELKILQETVRFAEPENFFELVRFDFIIDADFEVHLMEVNMSPNLTPSAKRHEVHGPSYEQVVFNVMRCLGFADDPIARPSTPSFDNLAVDFAGCTANNCSFDCSSENCQLCSTCIRDDYLKTLQKAYLEHQRKGDFKRVFPKTEHFYDKFDEMSAENQFMTVWYALKCETDPDWC